MHKHGPGHEPKMSARQALIHMIENLKEHEIDDETEDNIKATEKVLNQPEEPDEDDGEDEHYEDPGDHEVTHESSSEDHEKCRRVIGKIYYEKGSPKCGIQLNQGFWHEDATQTAILKAFLEKFADQFSEFIKTPGLERFYTLEPVMQKKFNEGTYDGVFKNKKESDPKSLLSLTNTIVNYGMIDINGIEYDIDLIFDSKKSVRLNEFAIAVLMRNRNIWSVVESLETDTDICKFVEEEICKLLAARGVTKKLFFSDRGKENKKRCIMRAYELAHKKFALIDNIYKAL